VLRVSATSASERTLVTILGHRSAAERGQSKSRRRARVATLEAGVHSGPWIVSLRGAIGLPSRSHDRYVSLEVSRHSTGAFVGRTAALGELWQLDVVARAALLVIQRSAFPRDARFSASPPATRTAIAGSLEARALRSPERTSPVPLGFGLGAGVLASASSFSPQVTPRNVR